jgi:hypothetical protein
MIARCSIISMKFKNVGYIILLLFTFNNIIILFMQAAILLKKPRANLMSLSYSMCCCWWFSRSIACAQAHYKASCLTSRRRPHSWCRQASQASIAPMINGDGLQAQSFSCIQPPVCFLAGATRATNLQLNGNLKMPFLRE